ncbi:MAG: Fur family transcriptional regulator [Bacteroidetes bacterium]|nr:MAG: Fur family transcriptional regulator [Bacteroidota bacterium]
MNRVSTSVEDFLKILYQLERNPSADVKSKAMADLLGISNAAITDMAKKLEKKGLVNYEKYKQLSLTDEGERIAVTLIRKHRLWETLLHRLFDLDMREIHVEAEDLEHATSDLLAERISAYLGHPQYDPHGDPIPDSDGNIAHEEGVLLLSHVPKGRYEVVRIASSDHDFFQFCKDHHITLSARVEIVHHYEKMEAISMEVEGKSIVLPRAFANQVYVKSMEECVEEPTHNLEEKSVC